MFTSHLTDFVECSGSKSSTVNSPHLVLSFIEGSKLCGIEKIFRFLILTSQDQPVIPVSFDDRTRYFVKVLVAFSITRGKMPKCALLNAGRPAD